MYWPKRGAKDSLYKRIPFKLQEFKEGEEEGGEYKFYYFMEVVRFEYVVLNHSDAWDEVLEDGVIN